jgi:hypothetical protein
VRRLQTFIRKQTLCGESEARTLSSANYCVRILAKIIRYRVRTRAVTIVCVFMVNVQLVLKLKARFHDFMVSLRNMQRRMREHIRWKDKWRGTLDMMWMKELQV